MSASLASKAAMRRSSVEQGRRHADRLIDLLRIAGVVGCSLEDLVGCSIDSLTIECVAG
jgi:hypothetical protein